LHTFWQHSAAVEQRAPSALHAVPPQTPSVHAAWSQQESVEQAEPRGVQESPPQKPAVQSAPQQSAEAAQAWPSGAQTCVGSQRPSVAQVRPPQQVTPENLQGVPTGEQPLPP
jgi:hypothetical protein